MNYYELEQLREDAITKLIRQGVWVAQAAKMADIVPLVEKITGRNKRPRQKVSDYLAIWLDEDKPKVLAPYRPEFRPMSVTRHPRSDDIQRAQPPLWTPSGTGNWNQYTQYMMDNGRAR